LGSQIVTWKCGVKPKITPIIAKIYTYNNQKFRQCACHIFTINCDKACHNLLTYKLT